MPAPRTAAGARYRLFFADAGASEAAEDVLRRHAAFLARQGSVVEGRSDEGSGLLWGADPYLGHTLMIRRGDRVAGSLGLDDRARGEALVRDVLARAAARLSVRSRGEGDLDG